MWHWESADELQWAPNVPCWTWSLEQARVQIELTAPMHPETPFKHADLHSPAALCESAGSFVLQPERAFNCGYEMGW